MRGAAAQTLCLLLALLSTTGFLTGCGERGPRQGGQEDVEDGADPSPKLRKKAVAYLRALPEAKDGQQERAAVVSLVKWLKSIDRNLSVRLLKQHSRPATMQELKAYATSTEPATLIVDLCCFPPRTEWIKHTFRDNRNIALFGPVLWVEATGPEAKNRQP